MFRASNPASVRAAVAQLELRNLAEGNHPVREMTEAQLSHYWSLWKANRFEAARLYADHCKRGR